MEYFSVGYVLKAHGLKGEIKVEALTDYLERFDELDLVYIEKENNYIPISIESVRYRKSFVYLTIKGYDNLDKAAPLKGKYLWITRDMTRKLPKDSYLIADLIGLKVQTDNFVNLGKITRVIHTGSNDVYVVKGKAGEVLIPALKRVFLKIDINNREIIVREKELEGLIPNED